MRGRIVLAIALAALIVASVTCRGGGVPVSDDVRSQMRSLQEEKVKIEQELSEIKRSRDLLAKNTTEQLDAIGDSLENVRNALGKIQARLDAIEIIPMTASGQPRRLSLPVSISLLVAIVLCVLVVFKLRSIELEEARKVSAEVVNAEAGSES